MAPIFDIIFSEMDVQLSQRNQATVKPGSNHSTSDKLKLFNGSDVVQMAIIETEN